MSKDQRHGFIVQNWFGLAFGITNLHNQGFDFHHDKLTGLPVGFKTHNIQSNVLALSSARTLLEQIELGPFLLVAAIYEQNGDEKHVKFVEEYHINPSHGDYLRGGLDLQTVIALEQSIKDLDRVNARKTVKDWKKQNPHKVLQIHGKIGATRRDCDTEQRRLQLSVRLDLIRDVERFGYRRHEHSFRGLVFPKFYSTPREFNKSEEGDLRNSNEQSGSVLYV